MKLKKNLPASYWGLLISASVVFPIPAQKTSGEANNSVQLQIIDANTANAAAVPTAYGKVDPATGLPLVPTMEEAKTSSDLQVELQAAKDTYQDALYQYNRCLSQFSAISFKAMETGKDGCRIEIGSDDYFLFGGTFLSDRFYSDILVKDAGNYEYQTVAGTARKIPAYRVCSAMEISDFGKKQDAMKLAKANFTVKQNAYWAKSAKEKSLKQDTDNAEKGDYTGLLNMAHRYEKGDGVEQDLAQSKFYLDKALVASNALVEANKSQEASRAQGDFERKFAWAKDQASRGKYAGLVFLGKCYRDGTGVEKDLKKAREYFLQAEIANPGSEIVDLLDSCHD
jgi:TPR repeat protein